MSSMAVFRRMMGYLRPYRTWALLAFAGVIGSTSLQVAIPLILGEVIDIGIARGDADFMLAAGALVMGLGVLRAITGFMFRFFGERLSHNIAYDFRNQAYDKVQNLSFKYHDNAHVGTLITRAISDVNEIQRFFAFGLIDGIVTLLLTVGVSAIMFATSPLLALIALVPMVPLAVFSRRFGLYVGPAWGKIMDRMQKLGNHIQENAVGAEVVRAFAREEYEIEKFAADNEQWFHEQLALVKRWGNYLPLSAMIIAFSTALVLYFGGLMEQQGTNGITVGTVVAFNAYVLMLADPLRFVGFVILLSTQAVSSAGRVFEIIDSPNEIMNKSETVKIKDLQGVVRFEDVNFSYDEGQQVLHDINLQAHPGEIVAVVGPTGAGKSSLVNLIPRFYDVSEGSVTIDDVDVRDVELSSLRKGIGIVLQSSLLFSATIRENIAYGRPDATEDEIIAAAKAANVHGFAQEFSEGYDTVVGERGVTLSGGQKQRIAIARALLINPRILILDDSTSSVDTRTEFEIREALDYLMKGRTTFIIAQRLNSVQDADQILVLQDGRITERGTHDELVVNGGYYEEIYHLQLEDQERVRAELISFGQIPPPRDRKRSTEEFRAIMQRSGGD